MFTLDKAGLPKLNTHLAANAYIEGFTVTKNDSAVYMNILMGHVDIEQFANIKRWFKHISTYTMAEFTKFSGEVTATACPCSGNKCDTKKCDTKKCDAKNEDEDEFSFGGDDDEDDEESKKAMEEMKKKKEEADKTKKPKKAARSMIVLHIKPYGDENDMNKVLAEIPDKIVLDGLKWGTGELQDHCYGVKMLAMPCVIVDDICSIDEVCELIQEVFEDDVQNCDIHAFNKFE